MEDLDESSGLDSRSPNDTLQQSSDTQKHQQNMNEIRRSFLKPHNDGSGRNTVHKILGYRQSQQFLRKTCLIETNRNLKIKNRSKIREVPKFKCDLRGYGANGYTFARTERNTEDSIFRGTEAPFINVYYDYEENEQKWTKKSCLNLKFGKQSIREEFDGMKKIEYVTKIDPIHFKRNQKLGLIRDRGSFSGMNKLVETAASHHN